MARWRPSSAVKVEEERKRALAAECAALDAASDIQILDYAAIVQELRQRTADVQALLRRQITQARQMLRKLRGGKIAVVRLNVGGLLRADVLRVIEAAVEITARRWWPPTGFER